MRRSSKIALAICAFIVVYFAMVMIQLSGQSRKEFTQTDATNFLHDLGEAFKRSDASACVSFAWPDAKVAGEQLEFANNLLRNFFQQAKDPHVDFREVHLVNDRDFAFVQAKITALDGTDVKYSPSTPVTFKLERRTIPHLMGLVTVYDWKVVNVEAQLPPEAMGQ
jgi:hypothetical protein